MSKSKKKAPVGEGKYEDICREYRERDELETLNRKVEERNAMFEKIMWEQKVATEKLREKQEQRFCAVVKLVFMVVMALTIVTAVLVLAYTEAVAWWISITVAVLLTIPTAFKAGWLWYEFKH